METQSLASSSAYKIIYLIPVPFMIVSLVIFIGFARKETIIYYTQNGEKK